MAPKRPYHHGNLRQAVLDRAVAVLRDRGPSALSLRELARDIGVSHAAPGRHFPDRRALLDALAAEGFALLGARLREAVAPDRPYAEQVRVVAGAYVGFATAEANLCELMFAHEHGPSAEATERSAIAAFGPLLAVIRRGAEEGHLERGDPERAALIHLSTLQGFAALVNCGVIPSDAADGLLDEAVSQFLRGASAP